MATLSTHILDTSVGLPAPEVAVLCEAQDGNEWQLIAQGHTDADGRVKGLHGAHPLNVGGVYRLTFLTAPYFEAKQLKSFYPKVAVEFVVDGDRTHYHVPLLLNPFGYSTYRGS
jgi:5-hydroxyisourate hydrolase